MDRDNEDDVPQSIDDILDSDDFVAADDDLRCEFLDAFYQYIVNYFVNLAHTDPNLTALVLNEEIIGHLLPVCRRGTLKFAC
jgi:hypothetical protein